MSSEEIINKTIEFVKEQLKKVDASHDWWHVYRVWKLAKEIAESENKKHEINLLAVELGALLHDVADHKFFNEVEELKKVEGFLDSLKVDEDTKEIVLTILKDISFKGKPEKVKDKPIEFLIVQDADRLDAIGAIGIARTFSYGGFKRRLIYDPSQKPKRYKSKEEYVNSDSSTINHFYEKLLLLKDLMNTESGKKIAEHRHKFMEQFLEEFFKEWDGLC
ncbi:MAG: uncharacterized protein PWR32_783 [Candidatus Woesearchaeota archaeon]|nr:uncharacterized protein [Candidatus Woesearchaeota archaeon]